MSHDFVRSQSVAETCFSHWATFNTVDHVVNSFSDPSSTVVPVVNSLTGPFMTVLLSSNNVYIVVNSVPGPSNTVAPVLPASLPQPCFSCS